MRRLVLVALLVALAAGCGGSGGHSTSTGVPQNQVQRWTELERLPKEAVPGAALFESKGCLVCHLYAGSGRTVLNAPDLTAIGTRKYGIRFQIAHLKCPSCVIKDSPMPPSSSLSPTQLHQLAVFLEDSKGPH